MPHNAAISLVRKSRCQGCNPCARGRLAPKARPSQPAPGEHLNEFPTRNDSMQRQHCHSEEIGRSTKNLLLYCYRFLTALRLSFSSLRSRGRLRPLRSLRSSIRFAQNDKVSLSGIRAQPAGHACGPPPAKAAARTAQNSRPTHRHSLQKPLFRILRCIPFSDCSLCSLRATATLRREP